MLYMRGYTEACIQASWVRAWWTACSACPVAADLSHNR